MSARRIVALAVAIGCHLGLLVVMLRPDTHRTDIIPAMRDGTATLELQFITLRRRASVTPPRAETRPRPVLRVARSIPPPSKPVSTSVAEPPAPLAHPAASPVAPALPAQTIAPDAGSQASSSDGGFRDRLLNAQRAGEIHGVPGSDQRAAPGIQLTDPMDQGIGSVMRETQRLFGITHPKCIDVETWEHLTPDELIARHLTPEDVKKQSDKYNCNRPLGLSI